MEKIVSISAATSTARAQVVSAARLKPRNYLNPENKVAIMRCAYLRDTPEHIVRKVGTPGKRGPVTMADYRRMVDAIYDGFLDEIRMLRAEVELLRAANCPRPIPALIRRAA